MAGTSGAGDIRGDVRGQIGAFLSSRRARISPAQAGLPVYRGEHRRVPGLRREEVAVLAGISTEYYTRFERGNATGVSDSVIDGIAHALQLDDAERAHLLDLIRIAGRTRRPRRRTAPQHVRPAVQRIIDSMTGTPALVLNGRLDILTGNALGYALYSPVYADPIRPPNNARFIFLDPHATEFFRDWDKVASDTVAMLRAEAGRDPYDRGLSDLIGELSTRSDQFRVRWAAHNVRIHTTGVKLIHHPVVGDLDLPFESFPIPAEPSQSLLTYTTEPGSPSHDALSLLASWTASPAHDSNASTHGNAQQARSKTRDTTRATDPLPGPTKAEGRTSGSHPGMQDPPSRMGPSRFGVQAPDQPSDRHPRHGAGGCAFSGPKAPARPAFLTSRPHRSWRP